MLTFNSMVKLSLPPRVEGCPCLHTCYAIYRVIRAVNFKATGPPSAAYKLIRLEMSSPVRQTTLYIYRTSDFDNKVWQFIRPKSPIRLLPLDLYTSVCQV